MTANPFAAEWTTPFGLPAFVGISPEQMREAFHAGFAAHMAEIEAIAADPAEASFANVTEAMERAGQMLSRVSAVFYNVSSADTNDALQAIERDMAPLMAKHWSAITLHEGLFARLDALFQKRGSLGLNPEQLRLVERSHANFVRAGAGLPPEGKTRLSALNQRLAEIGTSFSQNLLKDESSWMLPLEHQAELEGLPEFLRAAMRQAATERGLEGQHAVTLSRSIIDPFLTFSARRDLREAAFKAWSKRGANGGETDNRALIAEMVKLRAEKAKLLGFSSFAHLKLDNSMAKTPEAVMSLLNLVWGPAKAKAAGEAADLAALARIEGQNDAIQPWDWRYYSEKVRSARFALDETAIKPYLQLDNIIEAAFDTASRLFGLVFTPRPELKGYHPDVRVWEVNDTAGRHVGLFLGDYFARASKRSGAWMSLFRSQDKLDATEVRPIVTNVCNFAKPSPGEAALLSIDDARTLFHEFGHALHGLLSDVTYPSLSCTSVSRDFVELPSQLYEHWFMRPEIMSRFCLHSVTGEPMPDALIAKLKAAQTFNQGFATVEYTSCALIDMAFHALPPEQADIDPFVFEAEQLERLGMPSQITMRHRTPQFAHVFSGDGYAAGYYSYLWSEVMDADAFDAFTDAGDVFDAGTADKLKRFVYSAGNSRDPAEAYTLFRGRMPTPEALMEKRGLVVG